MLGSAVFESLIGTTVIYILLSLLCLVLNEWVTRIRGARAGILKQQLELLLGLDLFRALAAQQLIRGTFEGSAFPNYISSNTFALALIAIGYDYLPGKHGEPGETKVKENWTGESRDLLESLRLAAPSLPPLQARIENWFDQAMERASGVFKRQAQLWVLAFSAIVVGVANVDTLAIAGGLYDGAMTHQTVGFALFWHDIPAAWFSKFAGMVTTWGAVSLGAPFWFDILNKLVNLRQTGLPPDEDRKARDLLMVGH